VEIASDRVTAVSLARQGATWIVSSHATERIAPGTVTPALNAVNVHDARVLAAAVRSACDKLGSRPRRVALVIPDTAAKLSLLRFEKVPGTSDLDQLIRWQMRKAAPFKPEDAQISWVPAARLPEGGREYLVTLARIDVVESYMRACSDAGAEAGVVDLASLNLINAALAAGVEASGADTLLVHVAPDYATLAIVRNKDLIFFRTRQLDGEADLADLVHQTAMYHEDRLNGATFSRVVLSGASARGADAGERLRKTLEERMGVRVEPLDFRSAAAMRDRIAAGPDLLDTLAPAVGVVLRERVA
jgi:type IV pilus assembly protein PilM